MSQVTTDHDTIRKWAERKGGVPAAVDRTHTDDDVGIVRLMFPKSKQSEHAHLVEISWDEFFEKFDESGLALIYEEDSLFSKLVKRETAESADHKSHAATSQRSTGTTGARSSTSHSSTSHSGAGKEPRASHAAQASASSDLKSREYKDADGTVHHHTRTYQKNH